MTTPQQLYATLEPIQQLNGTLQQTGPQGPPGPTGPQGPPGEHGTPTTIADEGVSLAPYDILNFLGAGVTAAVDAGNNRINVTIPGGAAQTPWTQDINAAGFQLLHVGQITVQSLSGSGPEVTLYNWAGEFIVQNAAERFKVAVGGNVGIPTPDATYKLNVTGDVNITGVYRVNGVAQGQTPWTSDINGGGHSLTGAGDLQGVNLIASGGVFCGYADITNQIVATVFQTRLRGGASSSFYGAMEGSGNNLYISGTGAAGATLHLQADTFARIAIGTQFSEVEIMRVASTGVGIPTPHATYKLNVTGDCNLSAGSVYRVNGVVGVGTLPTAAPAAGSKGLWVDAADANRVKYAT